jgi:hypothetical protein
MAAVAAAATEMLTTTGGIVILDVFEDEVPPRFRLHAVTGPAQTLSRCRSKPSGPMRRVYRPSLTAGIV